MKKQWTTVLDFIQHGKVTSKYQIVEVQGMNTVGDGGALTLVRTGTVGTPSQSFLDTGNNTCIDKNGDVWKPKKGSLVYYNGVDDWFGNGFGLQDIGNYSFKGDSWGQSETIVSKGEYESGILLANKYEYIEYEDGRYYALAPPYTTTGVTPDLDNNLYLGDYMTQSDVMETIIRKSLLTFRNTENSAIDNMLAEFNLNPLMYVIGTMVITGKTIWEYIDTTGTITLDNFRAFDAFCTLDFGLTGDGSDETSKLQRAVSETPENGTLFVHDGEFLISEDIDRDLPIEIRGAGTKRTHIKWEQGLVVYGLNFDTGGVVVRDLTLGTDYERPSGKPDGVQLGWGIRVASGDYTGFEIDHVCFTGLNNGIFFVDGASDITINRCRYQHLHHGTSSTTGGYGIVFQACQDTTISFCRFMETINRRGVYLSTNSNPSQESKDHTVIGCKFFGRTGGSADYPTGYEIHLKIRASSDVNVLGCTFDGGLGAIFGEQSDEHTMGNYPSNVTIMGCVFKNFNSFGGDASIITCMNRNALMKNWTISGNTGENCACRFLLLSSIETMVVANNTMEIVSGELVDYASVEVINGESIVNLTLSHNTLINKTPAGQALKMFMNSASGEAIVGLKLHGNILQSQAYNASDIRGYAGDIVDMSLKENTVKGYGGGAAFTVSTDGEITATLDGNDLTTTRTLPRLFQVSDAIGGEIRVGTVGGEVTVPSSAILVYSDGNRYGKKEATFTAIPTQGEWEIGDRIYYRDPVASGFIGAVCVTAGTPGTWKDFGAIDA
jgi:hypothetical protein